MISHILPEVHKEQISIMSYRFLQFLVKSYMALLIVLNLKY